MSRIMTNFNGPSFYSAFDRKINDENRKKPAKTR